MRSRRFAAATGRVAGVGVVLKALVPTLLDGVVGIVAGGVVLGVVVAFRRAFMGKKAAPPA